MWTLSHMWWEHLKDFTQQSKQDEIVLQEITAATMWRLGWRCGGWAGGVEAGSRNSQEGVMGPGLQ